MPVPDPYDRQPIKVWKGTAFLKAVVDHPLIEVGDYSYYDDARGPEHFVGRCVRYHFEFVGDRLIIGRFVAIATGVQFIMNGANHPMGGFSTYPFDMLGFTDVPELTAGDLTIRGDTVIGNDVWIGREAVILPGVRVGDGAIVGTRAVVGRDVPPYALVVGNPARVVRRRFDDDTIAALLAIAWWNWPPEAVVTHLDAIRGADLAALRAAGQAIKGGTA
ncbi:CatB-related O-acetyltransferase [Salinarimonas soli]|uniref:CatB-related O-acetyltransferase n=1 Tax=Salinarimonas soli TaxID=1638099 RepID=A0A5B2VIZ2_9HYPH|nr:CatB-related O-acetyltransferase [Salinarimonas soli]KAA2238312.1 CatB-related O-acetyltransferase [Salinarimonas soli]